MKKFIGRETEIKTLRSLMQSDRSEFVAIYGRRRVGKTLLVRTAFDDEFTFQVTGLGNANTLQQLTNFHYSLRSVYPKMENDLADNWFTAFQQLKDYIDLSSSKRKVLFIDELPWFDTRRSGFIPALEHFWNSWASYRNDIILIVCGSAASWMINKLINDKGGLHNRLTQRIKLEPFKLGECESLIQSKGSTLDRYQIIQLYMVLGGIPYYWDEVDRGKSAAQNINDICFAKNGLLVNEFMNLFRSLFDNYQNHEIIIDALAKKATGLTRSEIVELTGLPNAGSTTRTLSELEQSGFLRKYTPFNKIGRNSLYQLVDFYSLFYLRFVKDNRDYDPKFWKNHYDTPGYRAWSGYAFEQVAMYHLEEIKKELGISGVQTSVSSWKSKQKQGGCQIDLLINRRDQVINLCEMKYSINPFRIDKKYTDEIRNKIAIFKKETKTRKSVFFTMITTFGLQDNSNTNSLVQNSITMDALFLNQNINRF